MTEVNQIYKCEVCGNVVEVLHKGADALVCCDKPMVLMAENSTDAAVEKHVPVVEETDEGVIVKVGEVPHPMTEEHYIEWVEVISEGKVRRFSLNPGDAPEVKICCKKPGMKVRAYCNLHGLWVSE